ncbi:hypothetical protein A5875_003804, partial [Enterococcus sp. 3H8_DIV0648]
QDKYRERKYGIENTQIQPNYFVNVL